MSINPQIPQARAQALGLNIHNARLAHNQNAADCAKVMGLSEEEINQIEAGQKTPSLPQLEALAYHLDIPVEEFLSDQIPEYKKKAPDLKTTQYTALRQKIIGAKLQIARSDLNLTLADLAQNTSLPETLLHQYEVGEIPIPLTDLEIIADSLQVPFEELFDNHGVIGEWRLKKQIQQQFTNIPEDLREFVSKPINTPYVRLAIRLSELSVEKLRAIAESLLEITF